MINIDYKSIQTKAFTLAEVMVVMLVLSIILAAFAPMMTTRRKVDLSSPWKYASNNSDIYYGLGTAQTAMIGTKNKVSSDIDSRIVINANPEKQSFIIFKDGDNTLGQLYLAGTNVVLGGSNSIMPKFKNGGYLAIGNTGFGYNALGGESNIAMRNTAVGYDALSAKNLMGGYSTAVGYEALKDNAIGKNNTAIGNAAIKSNYSGGFNTAVGSGALASNYSGGNNVAVGTSALNKNYSGGNNVAIGASALNKNYGGNNNVAIGFEALNNNVSGENNIAIGQNACKNVTGSNKICIGTNSGPGASDANAASSDNTMYIGTADTNVYIPGNLIIGKQAFIGTNIDGYSSVWMRAAQEGGFLGVSVNGGGGVRHALHFTNQDHGDDPLHAGWYPAWVSTVISDRRLKNVGSPNIDGLEKVINLKVYNYTLKKDKKKTPHVGVIAQDLQKIFPNAVIKGEDGYLSIRMEDIFYAIINAVKELNSKMHELANKLDIIEAQNKKIIEQNKEINLLKKQNTDFELRLRIVEKKLQ